MAPHSTSAYRALPAVTGIISLLVQQSVAMPSYSLRSTSRLTESGLDAGPGSRRLLSADEHTVGIIVGVTIGGVVAILLACMAAWWIMKKYRKEQEVLNATTSKDQQDTKAVETVHKGPDTAKTLQQPHPGPDKLVPPKKTIIVADDSGQCVVEITPQPATRSEDRGGLRLPWSSITLGKALGTGRFGPVFRGELAGSHVVVKVFNTEHLSAAARVTLHQQCLAICNLHHPCVAHVHGVVDEGGRLALVSRYYELGTVAAAISDEESMSKLDLHERLKMATQVAEGMCYLHTKMLIPMVHGDLKTKNLFLQRGGGVAIADFGLCGLRGVAEDAYDVRAAPPELLEDPTGERTRAWDVFAFGIVLLEIVSGNLVHKHISPDHVKYLTCNGRRPPIRGVPQDIAQIIEDCWAQDPAARPTFAALEKRLQAAQEAHKRQPTATAAADTEADDDMTFWTPPPPVAPSANIHNSKLFS